MTENDNTSPATLLRAVEIGKKAGLKFIYPGNLPGQVGDLENTSCPQCSALLIERYGYRIRKYHLTPEGRCPSCNTAVPGRWAAQFGGQIASRPFLPNRLQRISSR
jgi:pyruvate formate lyase activating enzyme